jgi:Oligosaccharyltransferase subunit Ribophorin II
VRTCGRPSVQVDVPAGRADAVAAPAGAKPEIRHQFRAPEKHPLALIPLTFAALQVPGLAHLMCQEGALWRVYAAERQRSGHQAHLNAC